MGLSIPFIYEPNLERKRELAREIAGLYEQVSCSSFYGNLARQAVDEGSPVRQVDDLLVVKGTLDTLLSMDASEAEAHANKAFEYSALSNSGVKIRFRTLSSLEDEKKQVMAKLAKK